MNNKNVEISVIITTHNRKYEVARALHSVLNQTKPPFEIIVVDDYSTDGTQEYLKKQFKPEYRYIYNRTLRGAGRSRNIGIAAARGEYIAFLDSDNEWYANKLEQMIKICEKKSDIDIICSKYKKHIEFNTYIYPGDVVEAQLSIDKEILLHNIADASATLYRKSFLEEVDGFAENMSTNIDWELMLRAFNRMSPNVYKIQEVLSENWEMHDSLSSNSEIEIPERIKMLNFYWNNVTDNKMKSLFYKQYVIEHVEYPSEYEKRFHFREWVANDLLWTECEYIYYDEQINSIMDKLATCEKQVLRKTSFYNMLYYWIDSKQKKNCFSKVLHQIDIYKVAIYGFGKHGKLLLKDLLDDGVEVDYIIDKEPKELYCENIKILGLKQELPMTDAIIITPYLEIESIEKELKTKTNAKIISLEYLVRQMQQVEET